jgi:hypothetical protein
MAGEFGTLPSQQLLNSLSCSDLLYYRQKCDRLAKKQAGIQLKTNFSE